MLAAHPVGPDEHDRREQGGKHHAPGGGDWRGMATTMPE